MRESNKGLIKKSGKKIVKILFFLGIRETYLFFRNLYGLVCHPFLTVKRIEKEKDLSQGLLIFGLPGYFWFTTIVFLAVLRFLIGIRGNLGWIAQFSLASITLFSSLMGFWLFWWFLKTVQKFNGGQR
jgi:hypothetical protein